MSDVEGRLAVLELEVRRLRDHDEILKAIASYGPLADNAVSSKRRLKACKLFTEDGFYDVDGVGGMQGRAEIERLFELQDHHAIMNDGGAHIMGLPHIVVDGAKATALNYTHVHKRASGSVVLANRWQRLGHTPHFGQFLAVPAHARRLEGRASDQSAHVWIRRGATAPRQG